MAKIVSNSDAYIRRAAFGYNDDNSCTAIAFGLALNYLDKSINNTIVNKGMKPENITVAKIENQTMNRRSHIRAYLLHGYLVNECGFKANTFGFWGERVSKASWFYASKNNVCSDLDFQTKSNSSKEEAMLSIGSGKVAMLTTLLWNPVVVDDSGTVINGVGFDRHTMLIYGYRYVGNKLEFLVHTGWYGDYISGSNEDNFKAKKYWISVNGLPAIYYTFSLNGKPIMGKSPRLTTVLSSPRTAVLSWGKIDGAKDYEIYRAVSGGSYSKIKTVSSQTLSYTDSGLKDNTRYVYKVRAHKTFSFDVYRKELYSDFSSGSAVSVVNKAPVITVTPRTANSVTLTIKKPGEYKGTNLKYNIYRYLNGATKPSVSSVNLKGDTSTYVMDSLPIDTKVSYKVSIYSNSSYQSAVSSAVSTYTKCPSPSISVVSYGFSDVTVRIQRPTSVTGGYTYEIYRSTNNSSFSKVKTQSSTTSSSFSFKDTSVSSGLKYYYKALCYKSSGNKSGYGNVVSAETKMNTPTLYVGKGGYKQYSPNNTQTVGIIGKYLLQYIPK